MITMWFPLTLLALSMLVVRRSTEKNLSTKVDSLSLAWLQQTLALPFIFITLFFAPFYWPGELSSHFWILMALYVVSISVDIYCYFKALSLADITLVAPLMTLAAVGNIIGAYFVLHQRPSIMGIGGAVLIILGAALINRSKRQQKQHIKQNSLAFVYVLILVLVRAYCSNIEVLMTREANPTTFNFYSSVLAAPFILLMTVLIRKKRKVADYWKTVYSGTKQFLWPLLFIGLTYTINLTATYQAKLDSPNAGYVGAIKSASVLPMVVIGVLFFKEKITRMQVYGLILILIGLVALATN